MIFAGLRMFDGLSFARNVDVSMLICADGSGRAEAVRSEYDIDVRSLEDAAGFAKKWTAAERDAFTLPLLDQVARTTPGTAVTAYSATPLFGRLLKSDLPLEILSISPRLFRQFDNKRVSKRLFRHLNIPVADFMEGALGANLLRSALDRLGTPVVVRLPVGSTGFQTFKCSSVDQSLAEFALAKVPLGTRVLIERFEPGVSLNINAVAFHDGEVLFEPSVQLIGSAYCSNRPFVFCGSDYPAAGALPPEILQSCYDHTRTVSAVLRHKGYRGLFGVDFILASSGRVLACEINSRMQNSTALINWSCSERHRSPAALHVAALREKDVPRETVSRDLGDPLTQVIAYADDACVAAVEMADGRYRSTPDGDVALIDGGTNPRALRDGDILVLGGPQAKGYRYLSGATLFRLILRRQAVDLATGGLAPDISRLVGRLKSRLQNKIDPVAPFKQDKHDGAPAPAERHDLERKVAE